VRLQLFALAYNLGNFLLQLALPRELKHWSLTTFGRGRGAVPGPSGHSKSDSHQIWRTQRVQVNVASLRLFLRSSTGPNRVFESQSLGRVRDPVRIAEGPTAIDAATQRRHSASVCGWLTSCSQSVGGAEGATHSQIPQKRGWPPMSLRILMETS